MAKICRDIKTKKKHHLKVQKINKVTVIEPLEEIYLETGRKLIRPNLHIKRVFFVVLLNLVVIGLLDFALNWTISTVSFFDWLDMSLKVRYVLGYVLLLLISVAVHLKKIAIFTIRVYQRYAPYKVRCMCLFIPNCSEYMILAIEKYGLIKGIKKGINRFQRCYAPNGGEDYP